MSVISGQNKITGEKEETSVFRNFGNSVFLHFVGRQIYNIFLPILLLKSGYSLNIVLIFFLLSSIITIITSYFGQKLLSKRSVINFNILAIVAEIALLLIILQNKYSLYALLAVAVFEAVYYAFYYLSYNAIVTHYTTKKRTGVNLCNLTIAASVASIIAPLAGALLLERGQIYLAGISMTFLFLSLIPLLKIAKPDINGVSLKKVSIKNIKLDLFNYGVLSAVEMVVFVLWGIYAYQFGLSLLSIGFIPIMSAVASILFTHFIKDHIGKDKLRRLTINASFILITLFSIYRFVLPEHILITNLFLAIIFLALSLSISTEVINKLKNYQTYYSSMLLSVICFAGRIVIVGFTFIVGLKYIILMPILFAVIYFVANAKVSQREKQKELNPIFES